MAKLLGSKTEANLKEAFAGESQALPRRPQLGLAQQFESVGKGTVIAHDTNMGTPTSLV